MMYRFGIIGAGFISNRFVNVLKKFTSAQAVAVADIDLAKASAFAEKHKISKTCTMEKIWQADVDIVYIGLPNSAHVPVSKQALENGKHVLCEKPIAMTEKDARDLVETAKRHGLFLMEGMWSRCLPVYRKIQEWICAGKIGKVRLIDSSFSEKNQFLPQSRLYNKSLGGGSMFDVGIYNIDFATGLLGRPIDVDGTAFVGSTGVDEQAVISLSFKNGAIAYSSCGFQAKTIADARIYGSNGFIWVKDFYKSNLCILYDNDSNEIERFTDVFDDGFQYEIEHVLQQLDHGKTESDLITLEDSIISAQIYDKLRTKWKTI